MYLKRILKKLGLQWWLLIILIIAWFLVTTKEQQDEEDEVLEILDSPAITRGIITSQSVSRYSFKTYYKYTVDTTTYFYHDAGIKGKRIGDSVWVVYSEYAPHKSFLHQSNYQ